MPNTTPTSAEKPAAASITQIGTLAGGKSGIIAAMPMPASSPSTMPIRPPSSESSAAPPLEHYTYPF